MQSFNAAGAITHRFLHGPAADQVLLEERFTPGQPVQTLWPLADHLGTARVILDGAGLMLSRLTYDSFGNLVNVPAIVPTFTFTGRDYDDEGKGHPNFWK